MQHGIITLLIVNIFISILLYINNKRLKSEIEDLKGWCKSKLNQIIDEETNIDKKLAETIKQISDNKVAKDVIEIMDYEGKCPYHNTVFKDLIEYQSDKFYFFINLYVFVVSTSNNDIRTPPNKLPSVT